MNEQPIEVPNKGPKKFRAIIKEISQRLHQQKPIPGPGQSLSELPDGRQIITSGTTAQAIVCANGVAQYYTFGNALPGDIVAN